MIDIFGIELLNQKLEQTIQDVKIESYVFNGQIENEINSIYLKFDNWINLFFDDGVLFIKNGLGDKQRRIESEGNTIEYQYIDNISRVIDIKNLINKRLTKVTADDKGLILTFENSKELIINQQRLTNEKFGQIMIKII